MSFADSYLGRLRAVVGQQLLLVPGARCVNTDDAGRILLERRRDFGLWGLPGGNAEPEESIETTILREVEEETGLRLPSVTAFGFASDPATETVTFPNGDRCQFLVMLFTAEVAEPPTLTRSSESLDLAWFLPSQLPTDMLENMRATIAAYLRFKETQVFQLM